MVTTKEKYFEAIGRRKNALAQVRISPSEKTSWAINGKELQEYFKTIGLRNRASQSLKNIPGLHHFSISVHVSGGGSAGQAEGICLGIARALVKFDQTLKKQLRDSGFLTRDARVKERRKFGLKKARKAPQWSKR